jgi:hypothetical protein
MHLFFFIIFDNSLFSFNNLKTKKSNIFSTKLRANLITGYFFNSTRTPHQDIKIIYQGKSWIKSIYNDEIKKKHMTRKTKKYALCESTVQLCVYIEINIKITSSFSVLLAIWPPLHHGSNNCFDKKILYTGFSNVFLEKNNSQSQTKMFIQASN